MADAIASWVLVLDGLAMLALIGKVILEGRWTHVECEALRAMCSVDSHRVLSGCCWQPSSAGSGRWCCVPVTKLRAAGAVALTIPIFLVAAVVGMFGCY
jgi:hypothetical protein